MIGMTWQSVATLGIVGYLGLGLLSLIVFALVARSMFRKDRW